MEEPADAGRRAISKLNTSCWRRRASCLLVVRTPSVTMMKCSIAFAMDGRPGAPRGAWVLVPADDAQVLPVLDGKPIPVITAGEWANIPEPWLQNVHRGS
jgi:hypothetical protein